VTISPEKIFYREKRALLYIHPRSLNVGYTVRFGAMLRC